MSLIKIVLFAAAVAVLACGIPGCGKLRGIMRPEQRPAQTPPGPEPTSPHQAPGKPQHQGPVASNPSERSLRELADRRGVLIGAAFRTKRAAVSDDRYLSLMANEFNVVGTESCLKMQHLSRKAGEWNFKTADKVIELAEKNGQKVHGHVLVYHNSIPDWITRRSWKKAELLQVLEDHVRTVVRHFKGRVHIWDAANEVWSNKDKGRYKKKLFYNVIGEDYPKYPFIWAHEEDPEARLIFNGNEYTFPGPALDQALRSFKRWLDEGVPIHGVGIQLHVKLDMAESVGFEKCLGRLGQTMDKFRSLGLDIHITELDVAIREPVTAAKLERQARLYGDILALCLEKSCKEITMWGCTDAHSWINDDGNDYGGYSSGLLFDAQYQRKPAYHAFRAVLAR